MFGYLGSAVQDNRVIENDVVRWTRTQRKETDSVLCDKKKKCHLEWKVYGTRL